MEEIRCDVRSANTSDFSIYLDDGWELIVGTLTTNIHDGLLYIVYAVHKIDS